MLGLKYDLLARKTAADLLVMSWHVSSASGQRDVRCGLRKAAIAVRQSERESKKERERERAGEADKEQEVASKSKARQSGPVMLRL